MTSVEGSRVVMVVGATSGIGLAVARQLAARGDRLVLVARDADRLHEVAASLPGDPLVAPADLVDGPAVTEAVAAAVRRWDRLDAVVTSAQAMAYGSVEQVPVEVLHRLSEVAVTGTHHLVRATLPVFRSQGRGTLVVVSSLLAEIAVPSMGAYVAAKWGQLGLVRTLQAELRREPGLHVCLVAPGAVDTPIYAQAATYGGSAGSAPPPVATPESVAEACVSMLDRPRRMVRVGPANPLIIFGFRVLPWLYDRIVNPLVDRIAVRGPAVPDSSGNVLAPVPAREGLRGGWTAAGRLRRADGRARWRRVAEARDPVARAPEAKDPEAG